MAPESTAHDSRWRVVHDTQAKSYDDLVLCPGTDKNIRGYDDSGLLKARWGQAATRLSVQAANG